MVTEIDNYKEHELHTEPDAFCSTCYSEGLKEDPGEYLDMDRDERASNEADMQPEYNAGPDV